MSLLKKFIEVLETQKEIFGDELFEEKHLKKRTPPLQKTGDTADFHTQASPKKVTYEKLNQASGSSNSLILEKINEKKEDESFFAASKEEWELTNNLDDLNRQICECQNALWAPQEINLYLVREMPTLK